MNTPVLVSFNICPFVFRAVAAMHQKGLNYKIEYIDLQNKPEWFNKISPFGKVPLLIVDDKGDINLLFESTVIMEYIDDANPPSIAPQDPLQKAFARAYYELSSQAILANYQFFTSKNPTVILFLQAALKTLQGLFSKIEDKLSGQTKFFSGDQVELLDFAFSPVFVFQKVVEQFVGIDIYENFPKVKAYGQNLLALESVQKAKVEGFDDLVISTMKKMNCYLLNQHEYNKPILISFLLCPFVHRVRTLLEFKNIDYELKISSRIVDQKNQPEWLKQISPMGKVPVLQIGDKLLFESTVILEYLDETHGERLLPVDPFQRAQCRAYFTLASEIQSIIGSLAFVKEQQVLDDKFKDVNSYWFTILVETFFIIIGKNIRRGSKIFYGKCIYESTTYPYKTFSLADAVFAPGFARLLVVEKLLGKDLVQEFPKSRVYIDSLGNHPAVIKSAPEGGLEANVIQFYKTTESIILAQQ